MASRGSQLRPSPIRQSSEQSSSSVNQQITSQTPSSSAPSADSQSIPLNNPPSAAATADNATPPLTTKQSKTDLRLCWICQQDETEDPSEHSAWRAPCPCSLTAHESCLLEWIANEEAAKPGQIGLTPRIVCPQCQAEIKIQRPRDYLVAVVDRIQRLARQLMWPTAASGLAGCVYSGLLVYGFNTMQIVFGSEETRNLLGDIAEGGADGRRWARRLLAAVRQSITLFDPFFPDAGYPPNLKIFIGLPLIGPSLIILRTRFADQAFALLLPLYFMDPAHRNALHWPPSPGLAFATVPYIRTAYNEVYRRTVEPLEKKWELAVQRKPREGETAEEIAAQAAMADEGEVIFEIDFGQEEINPARDREALGGGRGAQVHPGNNIPENPADAPVNIAEAEAEQPPNERGGRGNVAWDVRHREDVSIPQLANTVMGALFLPVVSSLIGDLLKHTLPSKWVDGDVAFRIASKDGGLLKDKWGRTLVGGCLFVVLKDVVTLYCKWRKAKDFGKRKVLDYVGKNRREV